MSSSWGPKTICSDSIERMLMIFKRFHAQHGLRHAPLAFVHGAATALNALVSIGQLDGECRIGTADTADAALQDIMGFLQDMASTWKLAERIQIRFRKILDKASQKKTQLDEDTSLLSGFPHDDTIWNLLDEDQWSLILEENLPTSWFDFDTMTEDLDKTI